MGGNHAPAQHRNRRVYAPEGDVGRCSRSGSSLSVGRGRFFILGLALLLSLGSRMQLVLMDIVATRTTSSPPYGSRTCAPAPGAGSASRSSASSLFVVYAGASFWLCRFSIFFRSHAAKAATLHRRHFLRQPSPLFLHDLRVVIFVILLAHLARSRDFVCLPFLLFEDATIGDAVP